MVHFPGVVCESIQCRYPDWMSGFRRTILTTQGTRRSGKNMRIQQFFIPAQKLFVPEVMLNPNASLPNCQSINNSVNHICLKTNGGGVEMWIKKY